MVNLPLGRKIRAASENLNVEIRKSGKNHYPAGSFLMRFPISTFTNPVVRS
jgi:hypothetical protein